MSEGSWGGPCEFSYPRAVGKNAGEADRGQILEASMVSRPPGGRGVGGRASLPLPPPQQSRRPHLSWCVWPGKPGRPLPPNPGQCGGGAAHLERTMFIVTGDRQLSWSWGLRTGPQGSRRPGRSHTGLRAAAWSWLKGRCHLVTRRRGHPQSPWEEPPLVAKATSPPGQPPQAD